MTEADFASWANELYRWPSPIVPVPAMKYVGELRGKRVIVGLPGHGWRADLRADSLVRQESRSLVPVMPEADWYRAEQDRIEVFAPLIPAERVWVETIGDDGPDSNKQGPVSLDEPPVRRAIRAEEVPYLTGRRLVAMPERSDDFTAERGLRAVTEPYAGKTQAQVRVAAEGDWYRWAATGLVPPTRAVYLNLLWVE
ncbi:hypothetical protein HDA40_004776 [Hamadaea flava]|uniref:Uncharacterized protein n=1 Tax=Hamadaea flava TaxID=1742688 RepID=A0ABV8LGZ3_9ACTN|nr:hypothetical protein [Hamadaea flava]MCP2326269.1 hypothetical protein [Hamadaea flava]